MTVHVRNVDVGLAHPTDVVVTAGRIEHVGALARALTDMPSIDANGGVLVPGRWDHHTHLRALAARRVSLDASGVGSEAALVELVERAGAEQLRSGWLRVTGYDSDRLGLLTAARLDALLPEAPPLRVQHRSGHHWVVNGSARAALSAASGRPVPADGVLWDDDRLLDALPRVIDEGAVRRELQRMREQGVVGASDLTATNTAEDAAALRAAARGVAQLRVFGAASDAHAGLDGSKIVVDEYRDPTPDAVARALTAAGGRPVALHAVTVEALVLAIAGLAEAAPLNGAESVRIEHAFLCPPAVSAVLAGLGVGIGAHPGFIRRQGDRLATALTAEERADYQPLRTWLADGLRLFGGTDAPFGDPSVWAGMQAAVDRRAPGGELLNPGEAITPEQAFALFDREGLQGDAAPPAVRVGDAGGFCLLDRPWASARKDLAAVRVLHTF